MSKLGRDIGRLSLRFYFLLLLVFISGCGFNRSSALTTLCEAMADCRFFDHLAEQELYIHRCVGERAVDEGSYGYLTDTCIVLATDLYHCRKENRACGGVDESSPCWDEHEAYVLECVTP